VSALSWLNDLARWVAAWVPRLTLIPPTHRAVLFGPKGGAATRGPGLVFWWPIAQKMVRLPVVRQAMETCARLLPTSGGDAALIPRAAVCGLVLEYVIEDPLLAATATVHLQSLIDNRVQARFGVEWRGVADASAAADRTREALVAGLRVELGVRLAVLRVGNVGPVIPVKKVSDWSHQQFDGAGEP
jgi:regulator of protease activity HflC (stomatin/prohibitin superfamily)